MRKLAVISLVGLVTLVLTLNVVAGDDPGRVVDRLQDAYRQGSVEGMLSAYATNAVFEDVNQRHRFQGQEAIAAMLQQIVSMHRTIGLEEKRRIVSDRYVVVEYDYVGSLSGEALSQISGKPGCPDLDYRMPVTSWYRLDKGRIAEQKDFIDFATYKELQAKLLEGGTPKVSSKH